MPHIDYRSVHEADLFFLFTLFLEYKAVFFSQPSAQPTHLARANPRVTYGSDPC